MAFTAIVIGLGVTAQGMSDASDARYEARYASEQAAEENRKVQSEQKAQNAAQAANERRKQVREERLRRARVLQASQNTGTTASSGEMGAIGGMSTQLSSNIGTNLGALQSANNISAYSQNAANFDLSRQNAMMRLDEANQMTGFGMSLFSQGLGGANNLTANSPVASKMWT